MKKIAFLISFQLLIFSFQYSFGQWQQTSLPYIGTIQALASDSSNIFVGTGDEGVYVSTDNDSSWTAGNIGLKDHALYIDGIAINGTKIYIVTREGIYLSVNIGTNWSYIGPPLSAGDTIINAIALDGNNIFMCIPDGQGLLFSDNDGKNWTVINNGFTGTPNVYALSAKDSNIVAGIYIEGIYLSTDNGLQWNANTNRIPSDEDINVFVRNGNNLFAGGYKVYLSTDNGLSWNDMNNGITQSYIFAFAISGNYVFAGTYGYEGNAGAIYMSSNFGIYWTDISDNLENEAVKSLAVCGQYIYAGTYYKGLWKRPLSDIIGINEFGIKNEESGIKVYPNPVEEQTVVSYQLSVKGMVDLRVYDLTGREVVLLVDEVKDKGEYSLKYDAEGLKSGVYFVRMVSDEGVGVAKFVKE